ncbi:MAG: hypothetical protein V3U33_03495 [candidate division NC10 bacterium]
MAFVRCEFCSANVKEERLQRHIEQVHPAERSAIVEARQRLRDLRREGAVVKPKTPLRLPKRFILLATIAVLVVLLAISLPSLLPGSAGQHIHPTLAIIVNGESLTIPGGIGISGTIVGSIHTHSGDGIIHVESREARTLGDFFAVWGQPFGSDRVLSYVVDERNRLTMTVNGQPSSSFGRLVLEDDQAIVIFYGPR